MTGEGQGQPPFTFGTGGALISCGILRQKPVALRLGPDARTVPEGEGLPESPT
jgi:hypothetical protein